MGFCLAGCLCISGPPSVRGSRGDSLTVQCRYDAGWETYRKWWCRGEAWGSCDTLVITTGSEQKVQRGRVAIQDDHGRNAFTVTIEELQESDADAYWCGIQKSGTDLGHPVRVSVGPGRSRTPSPPPSSEAGHWPTEHAGAPLCLPGRRGAWGLHVCLCVCIWVGTHVRASRGGMHQESGKTGRKRQPQHSWGPSPWAPLSPSCL